MAAKDPAKETPSGLAREEAGKPKKDESAEEANARRDKYMAAKLKARRG